MDNHNKKNYRIFENILGLILLICYFVFIRSVSAADHMRTTGFFATSSEVAIASIADIPITLYVGDNLAGISLPMKSVYFTVAGNYTGGGTITFSIDSDAATLRTFTLPAVTAPTPFEILYHDPTNSKIQLTSSGSYSYTLNVLPSGVTLYGLSAKVTETHRYTPTSCADGASANEKMKTNEFVIMSSDAIVSSATSAPINMYIGDNISGITDPMKSASVAVHGVYTGGGTVTVMLDNDAASAKTFTLPAVAAPTAMEFFYKDEAEIINPASSGAYQYTLTITPSGVAIAGLAAKLTETHRYKPPTCGGFPVLGDLYSSVFDTTGTSTGPSYNAILWKGALGGPSADQGRVRFQIAASDCANGASNAPTCSVGSWSFLGGATCGSSDWFDAGAPDIAVDIQATCAGQFANKRYMRYLAEICSDDCVAAGTYTPRVDDIVINYSP